MGRWLRRIFSPKEIHSEQWIQFRDYNGSGWAQPDHFLVAEDRVVVFECKLTQTDIYAARQLDKLYRPLLASCLQLPTVAVQVYKNHRHFTSAQVNDPKELLTCSLNGPVLDWHLLR